jgi:thiamine biosynthesis protein ThiS
MIEVNGEHIPWKEGMTIQDVLETCRYTYPMVIIKVNGKIIKRAQYETYKVKDGDVVQVIHLMSGG